MRILIGLTYYRPHYSGLTIYTERLARALVHRGHEVTVLTSRFLPELPEQEIVDGVRIIRPAVSFRLSKGVIMPSLPMWALRLLGKSDVVNLHLPQMDAAYVAWMARALGKPVAMTYHCDLLLPKGVIHRVANWGAHIARGITAAAVQVIVTNSQDYADHSSFLRQYAPKVQIIPPPVEVAEASPSEITGFRQKYGIEPHVPVIGMVARLATEKGVEYLVEAMPRILAKHPNARVLYVGQYQNVMGEEQYAQRLAPLIARLGEHWRFLGILSPTDLTAFYNTIDVNVTPSLNSTESFGMVQVEAMTCGTPSIASDLPGMRCPVRDTGMGRIVPPRDSAALAAAILELLDNPEPYRRDADVIRHRYSSDEVARQYEAVFESLLSKPDNRRRS